MYVSPIYQVLVVREMSVVMDEVSSAGELLVWCGGLAVLPQLTVDRRLDASMQCGCVAVAVELLLGELQKRPYRG
jgi:hypothetical protein